MQDDRDIFFAEVCEAKLERLPFTLETPKGNVTVYAEEIDSARHVKWQHAITTAGGDPDEPDLRGKARLIILCVVRENGKPFFRPDDVDRLAGGRVRYMEPLYQLCLEVNRLGSFATLKKKSETTPGSTGCSPSAGTSASETSAESPEKPRLAI